MTGTITNIQRFCLSDGDGIRTMVFLKGCPLSCVWCHNPETQQAGCQLMYYQSQCKGCQACVSACPLSLDPRKPNPDCTQCGACAEHCVYGALKMSGYDIADGLLLSKLLRDRPFFGNKGGVTFSGGEPLAQPHFLIRMLHLCREAGINTAIETCGYAPEDIMAEAASLTDCLLFDLKCIDTQKHQRLTGASNDLILKNLAFVLEHGARVRLRLPIIPGFNESIVDARLLVGFLSSYPYPERAELLGYNDLGIEKYAALHRPYPAAGMNHVDASILKTYRMALEEAGIPCVIS